MDDLKREVILFLFSFFVFSLGVYGGYLKLYDKNSWLYKESEGKNWLYDLDGMRNWKIIVFLIGGGIGGIFQTAKF